MGIRPNFAEDVPVYGDKERRSVDDDQVEYSESSLAARRSANVLKLKQLKEAQQMITPAYGGFVHHESSDNVAAIDKDLDFEYGDSDTGIREMAELYSYSEIEEFGININNWKEYIDESYDGKHEQFPQTFEEFSNVQKNYVIQDLCSRMESADMEVRLKSARMILFLLQGSATDFGLLENEEIEYQYDQKLLMNVPIRKTREMDPEGPTMVYHRAIENSFICYKNGVFQALCTLLMTEIKEPFECPSNDGRISKASSRSSRNASLADLSDSEKWRNRQLPTMVDNEMLRVILAGIYHMIVQILDERSGREDETDEDIELRKAFREEVQEPIENGNEPLLIVLFDMLHPFYIGTAPHFPIKKIVLLIWKILLLSLGGWEELAAKKREKRTALGLEIMEDTITVAGAQAAFIAKDQEHVRNMAHRAGSLARAGMMARQMAYNDDSKDEDAYSDASSEASTAGSKKEDSPSATSSAPSIPESAHNFRQGSGEQTPRVGSPVFPIVQKKTLPWKCKTNAQDIEDFIQKGRLKYFNYDFEPGDDTSLFGLPPAFCGAVDILRKNKKILPNLSQYICALVKVMVSSVPSTKARHEGLNVLIDCLTPEMEASDILSNSISLDNSTSSPLEEGFRLAIDINRHKEIIVKSLSAILLLLNTNKLIQSRHEIYAYNYPQCLYHYVRNNEEWPVLTQDNIEEPRPPGSGPYFMWRNVFFAINLIRLLNKLVKAKNDRVKMLMVFKSAPVLKRLFKVRLSILQLYVLKAIKMQSRYLGRQWRKSNMDIISAIYSRVRHRMTDDWAFASDIKRKCDYQKEDSLIKASIERFHSRRYSKSYPQFAIEVNDAPMPGDDYLNRVDMRDFEPLDTCVHSVLGSNIVLGRQFKKNYEKWLQQEVFQASIDWDKLLIESKGVEDLM
uniref:N1221 domain-containing protein n=1 Tax=Caenorhabditis tropicalis TaxID=1561998 RepID=A0A1I7TVC9_9PELO